MDRAKIWRNSRKAMKHYEYEKLLKLYTRGSHNCKKTENQSRDRTAVQKSLAFHTKFNENFGKTY